MLFEYIKRGRPFYKSLPFSEIDTFEGQKLKRKDERKSQEET